MGGKERCGVFAHGDKCVVHAGRVGSSDCAARKRFIGDGIRTPT